jgi:hypothetical protein
MEANMNEKQKQILSKLREKFGESVNRKGLKDFYESGGLEKWPSFIVNNNERRLERGYYSLAENPSETDTFYEGSYSPVESKPETKTESASIVNHTLNADFSDAAEIFVPRKNPLYIKWGQYRDIEQIVKSKLFCTVFVTGLSGNGKTMMIEQACANAGRELVRVNITVETDEDDLFGGFRLIDGETKWFDGPVVKAMESGAVLLLDEVDLASSRIMALQPVLEGNPLYLKKVNRIIKPKAGFNIIATANTKGQGDDEGKFVGTNVLNEAFLERFSLTFEQEYPSKTQEYKIGKKLFSHHGIDDDPFLLQLLEFVNYTRKSYLNGSVTDIITTRRLVHIISAYSIFRDTSTEEKNQASKLKAISLCLNRFDSQTKEAFLEFYKKLQKSDDPATELKEPEEEEIFDATKDITF